MRPLAKRRPAQAGIRMGTLTLCLLIVSVVLAIVAVLGLQTARTTLMRADEFAATTEQYYENDAEAQKMLAQIGTSNLQQARDSGGIPAEAVVDGNTVSVGFMNGQAVAPVALSGTIVMDNGGIATSGLSKRDEASTPALLVELDFGQASDGNAYSIATWKQVRVYG